MLSFYSKKTFLCHKIVPSESVIAWTDNKIAMSERLKKYQDRAKNVKNQNELSIFPLFTTITCQQMIDRISSTIHIFAYKTSLSTGFFLLGSEQWTKLTTTTIDEFVYHGFFVPRKFSPSDCKRQCDPHFHAICCFVLI